MEWLKCGARSLPDFSYVRSPSRLAFSLLLAETLTSSSVLSYQAGVEGKLPNLNNRQTRCIHVNKSPKLNMFNIRDDHVPNPAIDCLELLIVTPKFSSTQLNFVKRCPQVRKRPRNPANRPRNLANETEKPSQTRGPINQPYINSKCENRLGSGMTFKAQFEIIRHNRREVKLRDERMHDPASERKLGIGRCTQT